MTGSLVCGEMGLNIKGAPTPLAASRLAHLMSSFFSLKFRNLGTGSHYAGGVPGGSPGGTPPEEFFRRGAYYGSEATLTS